MSGYMNHFVSEEQLLEISDWEKIYARLALFQNDFFNHITTEMRQKHDILVRRCLESKGFNSEYLKQHPDEFHLKTIGSTMNSSTGYYHFDELLFTISTVYVYNDNCDVPNKVEYNVYFRADIS